MFTFPAPTITPDACMASERPATVSSANSSAIPLLSLRVRLSRRCVAQRLLEILGLEKWVLGEQRSAVGMSCKKLENAANGDPHPANARLPAALSRFNRNPIKQIYRRHVLSLEHRAPSCRWHRGVPPRS